MKPLDNVEEFMSGPFRMPPSAVTEGPIPARLESLPRDRSQLPQGVWLRFESFGAERYKGWSVQMRLDEAGRLYLVTHLGDATAAKIEQPPWPTRPTQKLDTDSFAALRRSAVAFAAGPPYRGHEGLSYAPVFVLTVNVDGSQREILIEGYENDFVSRLRGLSHWAQVTPLRPR